MEEEEAPVGVGTGTMNNLSGEAYNGARKKLAKEYKTDDVAAIEKRAVKEGRVFNGNGEEVNAGSKNLSVKEQRRAEAQADEAYDRHTRKMESFYERTGARPYGEDAFKVQKDLLPSMSAKKLMQEHVKSGGVVKTAIADELQRRGYTPGADGWVKKSSISSAAKADAGAKKDRMQAAANAINKISDSHNNRGGKEDDWKQVRDILQKVPVGTVMEQTGDRGVKFQYEKIGEDKWKNTDPKYAYESDSKTMSMSWTENGRRPSVNFTTKDKALTREQVKAAQDAATSGRLNQALGLDKNGNKITRASMAGTGISKESAGAMSNVYDGGKKSIPASRVEVSDSGYQFAHGKKPRGKGEWAFNMGGEDVFFSGTYAEAKKKAIKEAARRGIYKISTGS